MNILKKTKLIDHFYRRSMILIYQLITSHPSASHQFHNPLWLYIFGLSQCFLLNRMMEEFRQSPRYYQIAAASHYTTSSDQFPATFCANLKMNSFYFHKESDNYIHNANSYTPTIKRSWHLQFHFKCQLNMVTKVYIIQKLPQEQVRKGHSAK